jgi:hypothetical protein
VTIKPDEWETLCLLLEEGWPGEFTEATARAWRLLLDDFSAEQVLVAIKSLVARGGTFRPSVAEVTAAIRKDPSAPTFTEAYALIYGKGGVIRARPKYAGRLITDEDRNRAMLDRASELHPLVAAFVNRYGLHRLRMLEVDDPEYGELRRKELAGEWDQFCEAMEGRDVAALVSGRRGEIGRFDPMSVLGAKPAQIEQEATTTGEGQ